MQGIVYAFASLEELAARLESSNEDQDLALPCRSGVVDGEWVLVTFSAAEEATTVPARVRDRGNGLWLSFETRDWELLHGFVRGQGRVTLPPPLSGVGTLAAVSAPEGSRALVVDADPSVLSIVKAMLEACGVSTESAHAAEEALDLLRRNDFDLVVVEPALDGMSGLEFCRRLRSDSELSQMPVLMLTSHTTDGDLREALAAGADDFVGKPFRAHELRARAVGLIQKARLCVRSARRA